METVAWILTSALLVVRHVTGYDRYSTAYMQDSCTCSSISHLRCESFVLDPLPQGAGNVALSRTYNFFKEFYCEFSIRAPSKRHRIMLTVNHISIPKTKGCKAGTLKIYDGPIGENPAQLAALCGEDVPQFSFRSNTDRVTLAYHQALSIINHQKSFNLTFTYFRVTGPDHDCNNSREFPCVNGLCIPRVLECDGWNNCGDGTDESMDYHVCGKLLTTSDPMVGIAVGVTVASLLIIVMASLIAYGVQNRKGPFFHDNVAMTTVTSGGHVDGTSQSLTGSCPGDVTDDVAAALSAQRDVINVLERRARGLELDLEDTDSVASSTELYAMGLHRHPPPPSYNSLFPDA